ncbi:methyl-CpG-binding domain protein 1 [Grus japonensis]|uniref:Methyl-CpG-binding domain protein 1 n=1 Tax=Grus japonensis TaxID=30415 RepID=A0ABC9XX90_GRUJA
MAEGWVECPALGPGWKRREAFRKSGATCGRTDTYYRSKIELSRFLGPDRDLRNFNFKQGLECSGPPKRVGCGACQACRIPQDCGICSACARPAPGPAPGPARPPKCLLRRCLRIVKKGLGCGSCPGCLSTEDCGSCCICLRRLQPGLKRQWRCLRRRCLRPKDEDPPDEKAPGPPPGPPPLKEELGPLPRLEDPRLGLLIASAPRLKGTPPEPSVTPRPPPPGDLGVLIAATPRVKQEQPQPSASLVPVPPRLPPAQVVVLDESEEEEEEGGGSSRVPLPLPPPPPRWPGAFLAELAEIPLPAHWGVSFYF